jgi:hypothetical protein
MTERLKSDNKCLARGQSYYLTHVHFYESPSEDPAVLEAWCYTDRMSYAPGETVSFHTSTTAKNFSIEVVRDGARPESVYRVDGLPGTMHKTPADAYASGCGWPVAHEWTIPADTRSGGYVVCTRAQDGDGEEVEQQHWFAVRPASPGKEAKILLVAATSTWIAYNEWGGANAYWGVPDGLTPSTHLSIQRPWSRGFIWAPTGAPRMTVRNKPVRGAMPRYEMIEYAFAYGLSKYYAAAGWALYERLFVEWAEHNGFDVDVITQHDLHFQPEIIEAYPCVALVGHDEYWSWEMRDAIDTYTEKGGNVARFGANFLWQVRLEDEGHTQVCYKIPDTDPLHGTDQQHLVTTIWDVSPVNRPAAATLGLSGLSSSVYARWSAFNPRSSGGYTTYRPDHWVFEGTDLYYGDVFGSEAGIFGYETDGVKYAMRDSLPYPTGEDGAPEALEILAMAPASLEEEFHANKGTRLFDAKPWVEGPSWIELGHLMFGEDVSDEQLQSIRYGAGMMAVWPKGNGTIFNAGSCEWVSGLQQHDEFTEQITRNVLDRMSRGRRSDLQ